MVTQTLLPAYDRFLEFLVQKATPEEILAFEISDEDYERTQELIERNSAGLLTSEEQAELEQTAEFDLLVSLLKAKAAQALKLK